MSYANPWMLIGLAGVLIPIIIHLITQHQAKRVNWGAMQFLMESVVHRSRKMLLEQILLLVARCLLIGLIAMALALPFVRPDSKVPWAFVLPVGLLGIGVLGAGAAVARYRAWRWGMFGVGAVLLGTAVFATLLEQWRNGLVPNSGGASDIAIVIDGSDSMNLLVDGLTNFQAAQREAAAIVAALKPGDAATIIVAGGQVQTNPPVPSRRPEELKQILAQLTPSGGMMSASSAMSAAAHACARGDNVGKKIILITDGQSAGWSVEGKVPWDQLAEPLKKLPSPPQVVLRRLPLPKRINNIQLAEIDTPAGIAGPDREQAVHVRVENTGTEAVTDAFDVELSLDDAGEPLRQTVANLQPGVAETVTFHVRPTRGGLHSLAARVARPDDLAWDNAAARVVRVFERVPILLVEGNATTRLRDRASWFLDLALAPDEDGIPGLRLAGGSAPVPATPTRPSGLYQVTTVDLPKIATCGDLSQYQVIVLADVPKLPTNTAVQIADFVREGGGLLISLGGRCQPSFYNTWQAGGSPLLPASLVKRRLADSDHPAVHPQMGSLQHAALRMLSENAQSDLGSATITAYWQLKPPAADEAQQTMAALSSGDPWLLERRIGSGKVIVSAVGLDRTGSDLPALQSFLPLVRQLVSHMTRLPTEGPEISLAGRQGVELRSPGTLTAQRQPTGPAKQGLLAQYFAGPDWQRRLLSRTDATISFNWPGTQIEGLAEPEFSVRWSGTLTPTATDSYTFTSEGETTNVWIDGKLAASTKPQKTPLPPLELTAGRPYAIRVEHAGKAGQGKCELFWQGKQLPRQVVPATCFAPTSAWRTELARAAKDGNNTTLSADLVGPAGTKSRANIAAQDDGASAYFGEPLKPGLYHLQLPDSMHDEFADLLTKGAMPIAVRSQPLESQLAVLSDADLAAAKGKVLLSTAGSVEEVIGQLTGETGTGQRLWRYLAIAALLLAVAEIALTRWIAVQRMVGHEPVVVFASETSPAGSLSSRALERFTSVK